MMRLVLSAVAIAALLASPLAAQLALPQVPQPGSVIGGLGTTLDQSLDGIDTAVRRQARELVKLRERATDRLLRQNRYAIERDANGDLARKGELLIEGASEDELSRLRSAGFVVLSSETIEGLDLVVTRLAIPDRMPLGEAEGLARSLAPEADISADNLHYQAGAPALAVAAAAPAVMVQSASGIDSEVGVIDGGPAASIDVVAKRGFAKGAPAVSNHGSAVASLLARAGVTRIRVADVYGTDPAGGNALAIARALGWLAASGTKVVTISLVGPKNGVVQKAIAAAQRKGVVVVAAVGNDGPAAPPAYPASYAGVVAITGVDGRGRALIEAGRALNLDYAAPGADIFAHNAKGRLVRWRGTSFAAPLAAARLAVALDRGGGWRARLDAEARDLGKKGPDSTFGRGLLCSTCARRN